METSKERSKNWVFTWNNYSLEDLKTIDDTWMKKLKLTCVMFGREVAPKTGTPHLQGFIVTETVKTFKQVKDMFPACVHIERMGGNIDQNVTYCKKEGDAVILGKLPMSRKDKAHKASAVVLEMADRKNANDWSYLIEEIEAGRSLKELSVAFPRLFGQYNKGFKEHFEMHRPKPVFDLIARYGALLEWQAELMRIIDAGANDRAVHWIYSNDGGVGKSDMLKHLVGTKGFEPFQNGTTTNVAHAWKGGDAVFDYSRDQEGAINYSILENMKNKLVFSPKYESATKMSEGLKDVFVVCFSNTPPDISKLSSDRWNVYEINNDATKSWTLRDARLFGPRP